MNHPDWQKCENCYSFVGSLVPGKGTCQHNPPNADLTLGFPITSSHSWCRQWSGMVLEGGNSYMGPDLQKRTEDEVMKAWSDALSKSADLGYPEQTLEPQNPA
jgi:hypothetical protein